MNKIKLINHFKLTIKKLDSLVHLLEINTGTNHRVSPFENYFARPKAPKKMKEEEE